MSAGFDITKLPPEEQTEVLRVSGHLDAKTAPVLLEHCARVRSGGNNLVLNLSAVTLIASSGIGALLALVEDYREAQTSVRIAAASPAVEAVVKLLNLDQFLALDASEEGSLSALRGS